MSRTGRRWWLELVILLGLAPLDLMASIARAQAIVSPSTQGPGSPCLPPVRFAQPILSDLPNELPPQLPSQMTGHAAGVPGGISAPSPGQVPLISQAPSEKPLPINLPTALRLANVQPIDIALASQRVQLAVAQLERARVLWLPTVLMGVDYFRHDGRIQDVAGNLFDTSNSSFMAGAAPVAVFAFSDALFAPLAARQVARAQAAEVQTARNDSLLAVAEAYFNVQQARGELAGAE